jgi:hypothetical protein
MRKEWLLVCSAAALTGCPNDTPKEEPARTMSADAQRSVTLPPATRASTAPAASAGPGGLETPTPKAYGFTDQAALGTLPKGVGIPVGQTAPDFNLPAHAKGHVTLDALLTKGEALLVFYRGGW